MRRETRQWVEKAPKRPGVYWVTTWDGKRRERRKVELDVETASFEAEPWDGWWWSVPIEAPDGDAGE
ncbi:MAG: hypothetical protein HYV07_03720 [Deltaproteobacteria bacterium]|nr:hypothetical protein [Deltaproteobacteria bacterium]